MSRNSPPTFSFSTTGTVAASSSQRQSTGTSTSNSGTTTPQTGTDPVSKSSSFYALPSIRSAWTGLVRSLSYDDHPPSQQQYQQQHQQQQYVSSSYLSSHHPPPSTSSLASSLREIPPLDPVKLTGWKTYIREGSRILSSPMAEEIRKMLPERLQIVEGWSLVYSLVQDGVLLGTLYRKCAEWAERKHGQRVGFVVVVRDEEGGVFGAYLSDIPRVQKHYYGNGECFLWKASSHPSLPPPPSADTTNLARHTTIAASPTSPTASHDFHSHNAAFSIGTDSLNNLHNSNNRKKNSSSSNSNGNGSTPQSTPSQQAPPKSQPQEKKRKQQQQQPETLHFKLYPYSGKNDYCILCEPHFLSLGGGDGRYGLWMNENLSFGHSDPCPTFDNEGLSEAGADGDKFGIIGVEVWAVGG